MNIIKNILLFIWQLPQNLVGMLLLLFYWPHKVNYKIPYYFTPLLNGGAISLGFFIISGTTRDIDIHHEHGHQIQSKYLGPLYLFVIGIPSIIWCGLHGTDLFPYQKYDYYKFYTESWADKLGGIGRDSNGHRIIENE